MRYLVTGKEMKLLDQNTSGNFKVPELVLMEQAAMHFVWRLCDILKEQKKTDCVKGIVFCGLGNNGADGIAIARLLNEKGIYTEVCEVNQLLDVPGDTSKSYQVQETIYKTYHYPLQQDLDFIANNRYDFVVDAVFGIGLSRSLNDEFCNIVEIINDMDAFKVAVDMPSGINSDDGNLMGSAVKCDCTITFSYEKLGQLLWPGCEYVGKVYVENIGITDRSWLDKKPTMACLEINDLSLLPKRPSHSNKGTFGRLLIVAGDRSMAGAAVLSVKAAYRCGLGLVKVFTHEENKSVLHETVPEALVSTFGNSLDKKKFIEDIHWADAIVIGPGLGQSNLAMEMIKCVQSAASVPVVWDADALNLISKNTDSLLYPHTEYIMTPHLGEFSRLTGNDVPWIQSHLVESAVDFARTYDLICVLKDFRTVIANPYGLSYLNLSGNNGMATGGSGDVLAGVIGALLAQGLKGMDAASYGAYIHGLAGDLARTNMGTHSIMASDIIDALKEIWKGIDHAE